MLSVKLDPKYDKYASKPNGDEWHLEENIKGNQLKGKGPHHVEIRGTVSHNGKNFQASADPDMDPPSFRIIVRQKNGYDIPKTQVLAQDRKKASSVKYLQDANDWTNYEMTGYFKINKSSNDQITMYGRGGAHKKDFEGIDKNKIKCQGSCYKARLSFEGKPDLAKQYYYIGGSQGYRFSGTNFPETKNKKNIKSIMKRWIGVKTCVFNLPDGNVKIEMWVDQHLDDNGNPTDNANTWDKVYEIIDSGQMGEVQECVAHCGAPSANQVFNWGGPEVVFRIDEIENMEFKKLSVREITPPIQ